MIITALESTNVKRLKAVAIVPAGNVVQISGPNGSGKSSILDSIYMALAGKSAIPSKPVRRGQDHARIKLTLGDVIVTRQFSSDGATSVTVEAESGARFPSPQRMLDDLLGELTFDPLRFSSADPKAQLETLRGLVKLDVDIDALDGQNARDYDERARINKDGRALAERVATLNGGIVEDMEVTMIDVSKLTAELTGAFEHNAAIERAADQRRAAEAKLQQQISDVQGLTQELERIQARLTTATEARDRAAAELVAAPRPSEPIPTANLRDKVADAGRVNTERARQADQRDKHAEASTKLEAAREQSKALTERMEARSKQKRDAIAAAKMPIDGLSFGDGRVLYNDIPFDQASSAEQLRVSFAIAMASNPKLKVVLIRDGSLLDDESMALVATMAEENHTQIWIERVGSASGTVGIVIEDGAIVSVDGVPAIAGADTE